MRLLGLGMDPFYDEKVKDLLEDITSNEIAEITKKYFNYPFISVSGSRQVCKYLKEIWKKKY